VTEKVIFLNGLESEGGKTIEKLHVSGGNSPVKCESSGGDHRGSFPFPSQTGLVEKIGRLSGQSFVKDGRGCG
jgi:hypothetical protein